MGIITSEQTDLFGQNELAVGMRVSDNVKDPLSYLSDMKEYDRPGNNNIKKEMELCNKLYKYEGTVGNAVDILVEMALTHAWAEDTGDEKLNKILKYFNENVNNSNTAMQKGIYHLLEKGFLSFLVDGNVFPYTSWDTVRVDKSLNADLPMSIVNLNPQHISIDKTALTFGQEIIAFSPSSDLISKVSLDGRSHPEVMLIKDKMPRNLLRKIKNKKYGQQIFLDPKYIFHIKRKSRDHEAWGTPFLSRVFAAVSKIRKISRLEEATIEGLIALLTIFKIGTDEFPASPGRLAAAKALLEDPSASTTLVWAHDIDVKQVGPDGKILSFRDKFQEAYAELKRCFGVVPGLLGETANVTYEDLLAMEKRLETMRNIFKTFIEVIYKQIADENGYPDIYPKCKMARMNLYDDAAIKNQVINFYDRGLIDPEVALTEAGYDYDGVLQKKKRNRKDAKLFVPPKLPFSNQDTRQGDKAPEKDGPDQDVNLDNKKRE